MPSLALSEEKKMKKSTASETTTAAATTPDSKKKKEKKPKKLSDSDGEEDSEKKKSKKKKRKAAAESSDSGSELVEPESSKKKVKLSVVEDVKVVENPNAVSKFRISDPLREKLKEKGIEALFPIQATTFDMVLDGADLVGRARTGQVLIGLMFC